MNSSIDFLDFSNFVILHLNIFITRLFDFILYFYLYNIFIFKIIRYISNLYHINYIYILLYLGMQEIKNV